MKLANNLQIEQLLNTDWASQFNKYQLRLIRQGLDLDLDVSIYAKPELSVEQMREIREGLEAGIDVTSYADPKIPRKQMSDIRRQLMYGE